MNPEDGYIMDDLGPQNDGEPAVVSAEAEAAPEVPETPAAEAQGEASEAGEEQPEEPKPHKKPGSVRLKEQRDLAKQEAEYWRRVALEKQQAASAPVAPAVDPAAPKLEDFDTHEAWVRASVRHEAERLLAEREMQAEATKRKAAWETQAAQARAKYEDFDDALDAAPAPSMAVAHAMVSSPVGGELAYYLATNPDVYARINAMPPVEAALELGRLEGKFQTKTTEAPKTQVSKAPKPLAPVASAVPVKPADDGGHLLY